jgi:hypothetical protein
VFPEWNEEEKKDTIMHMMSKRSKNKKRAKKQQHTQVFDRSGNGTSWEHVLI